MVSSGLYAHWSILGAGAYDVTPAAGEYAFNICSLPVNTYYSRANWAGMFYCVSGWRVVMPVHDMKIPILVCRRFVAAPEVVRN